MKHFGGGMPCVYEIRGDGVAPIPVPDAREQAHKSRPKTCRLHQTSPAKRGVHQAKNARGVGQSPTVFAREARGLFLSLPKYRAIVTGGFYV